MESLITVLGVFSLQLTDKQKEVKEHLKTSDILFQENIFEDSTRICVMTALMILLNDAISVTCLFHTNVINEI